MASHCHNRYRTWAHFSSMGQVVRKGMNGMRIGLRLRVLLNTLVVIVFVAVCVTSAFAQAMEAQPHESLENLACGNCHLGVTGGNPFHDAIPNLLDAGQRYQSGFLSTIGLEAHGRRAKNRPGMMPAFPLSEGERHALKAYLPRCKAPKSSGVSAFLKPLQIGDKTAIERGRDAYHTVYDCQRCHVIDGEGGQTGNDLTGTAQKLKPEWLQKYLLAPAVFEPGSSMPSLFVMPNEQGGFEAARLDRDAAQDVADVVAYLFSKSVPITPSKTGDPVVGQKVFDAMRCANCHQRAEPVRFAPELSGIARRLTPDYLRLT